jgi:hypothetical protein
MFGADTGAFAGEQTIAGDTLHIAVTKCAAWAGAERANLKHTDQACITCETVWQAWFGALLPGYTVTQAVTARMGYGAPACRFCAIPANT